MSRARASASREAHDHAASAEMRPSASAATPSSPASDSHNACVKNPPVSSSAASSRPLTAAITNADRHPASTSPSRPGAQNDEARPPASPPPWQQSRITTTPSARIIPTQSPSSSIPMPPRTSAATPGRSP